MFHKEILAAPGPTPLPPEVLTALAKPIIHHRTPKFSKLMEEVREGLKYVFQTKEEVIVLASSGTGAMESAVINLTSPGDKILTIEAGKFGERWGQLGKAFGLEVIQDKYEYGETAQVARVEKLLKENPDIRMVCVQASETSTGVAHPIKELAQLVKNKSETILAVDAITGIGVFDLPMDDWGIDALIGGSQKAFMLPPGLSFIALSQKAWGFQEKSKHPRYYFDLAKERTALQKNQNAYTPAVNLIEGLKESLNLFKNETLAHVFKRHALMAEATQSAVKAIGLTLFAKETPANGLTAVNSPSGVDGSDVAKTMRDKYRVTIAGGQGTMKGKIFRLSHMGYVFPQDMLLILSALEYTLKDLGYGDHVGKAVAAAEKVIVEGL